MTQDQGIIILKVLPNSPAAKAELQAGDVIVSVNGTAIKSVNQIQQQVDKTGINNAMQVTVNRNRRSQQLTIRPEALPAQATRQT